MKKIIQKFTKLVALLVYLSAYCPTFAYRPQADQAHETAFFDINEEHPWHFGVKSWVKAAVKYIDAELLGGAESVIGPFVEWQPWYGVGLQTGLMYTYNSLFERENDSRELEFKAISIPFSFRFYPGGDRQFVLHIGPRIMIPLGKAKETDSKANPNSIEHDISGYSRASANSSKDREIGVHHTWDWGFDYNTKSGFTIGMSGFGLMLGFDCAKLFSD